MYSVSYVGIALCVRADVVVGSSESIDYGVILYTLSEVLRESSGSSVGGDIWECG